MPIVWDARPDAELVIAGKGPSEVELIDDPRIRKILRYVGEEELDDLVRSARLVVAPYTEGSQSGVVSLACASGVPSIVTAVGALPSLVVDSSQVVRPNDPEDLARSLLQYLEHSNGLREATHRMAVDRLSWRRAGEQTLQFYYDALQR
jgi:glycosyltransferase involved in cell wall biosynthesis